MIKTEKSLTIWNSIVFCLSGLRSKGLPELKSRFDYCWDQHLHMWIGARHKKVVEGYFSNLGVTPVGGLSVAISEYNRRELQYYSYAINKFLHIPGVKHCLSKLAKVERAPDEEQSHNGEQKYHNLLVELHACCFIQKWLKMVVVDTEYPGHSILSPNRTRNKSCDIEAKYKGHTLFFECKDSSWEIISKEPYYGAYITTPKSSDGCKCWILQRMQMAAEKGADYLIAKISVWTKYKGKNRDKDWMRKVFPEAKHLGGSRFLLPSTIGRYGSVKGTYILNHGSGITIVLG